MRLKASGVRDTARSWRICPNTVWRELKKQATVLESVTTALLRTLNPAEVAWDMKRAGEAEIDEMWSVVGNKGHPRWLGHALDHHTGKVLAYVFGRRTAEVFVQLKTRLEPVGLTRYYPDHGDADARHLDPAVQSPGQHNTQKSERTQLTLRRRIQRLVRKTMCFSTTIQRHDLVIGLFVNRHAFGRAVSTGPSPLLKHYQP
jgi:IS1 family transposase